MRTIPPAVAQIGEALTVDAGGYLRNTVRAAGVTCATCATPTDGYPRCYPCNQHVASGEPIADRVGTMVYAVKNAPPAPRDQTYVAMYGYKAPAPQQAHTRLVRSLAALGIAGHWECAAVNSGHVPTRWTTVPGTRHTAREHPLRAMVGALFAGAEYELPVRLRPGTTKLRSLRSEHLQVTLAIPRNAHVMAIDDSWVTGSSAQSVAIALKHAGASEVSILALARVLGPDWAPNAAFLKSDYARSDFEYAICPWTGGACP